MNASATKVVLKRAFLIHICRGRVIYVLLFLFLKT